MKKLEVVIKDERVVHYELIGVEVYDYINLLESCVIIYSPKSILTYKIEGTNYFFRDSSILEKIRNTHKVTSRKNLTNNREKFKVKNINYEKDSN